MCNNAWTLGKGDFVLKSYIGSGNASSFYDKDNDLIRHLQTTFHDTTLTATFNFDQVLLGLYSEYGLTDNLTLIADIPFGYSTLEESDNYAISGTPINSSQRTITNFSPLFYGIGARYKLSERKKMTTCFSAIVRIPQKFRGNHISSDENFASSGVFSAVGGVEIGIPASFGWVEVSAKYNWQDKDYTNNLLFHGEVGLTTIPKSYFKLFLDLQQSAKSFRFAQDFHPNQTPVQENYLAMGGTFGLFLSEKWFVDAKYNVYIFGANTWSLSSIAIGGGIKIGE